MRSVAGTVREFRDDRQEGRFDRLRVCFVHLLLGHAEYTELRSDSHEMDDREIVLSTRAAVSWGVLLLWVLASGVAFGVGGRMGVALSPSRDLIVTGYLAVTASLILAGALQWLILRRLVPEAGWWVPVSVVSVAIVGVLVFGLGLINRDVGWVLGVAVGWIVLGALQWLVLRGQVAGAGWWVLANTLALMVAIPVVGFVTWASGAPADGPIGGFLRWLAFGAAYGAVMGTALWWLLREGVSHSLR